jgi:hypothetical protein
MTDIRRELRGPVLALVLLALFARLLAPFAATAATERAAFDAGLRASLCLPSGLPAPDAPDAPAAEPPGHCPLCRLPDADPVAAPSAAPALAAPAWWPLAAAPPSSATEAHLPPPRGPPPARAPPSSLTIG